MRKHQAEKQANVNMNRRLEDYFVKVKMIHGILFMTVERMALSITKSRSHSRNA